MSRALALLVVVLALAAAAWFATDGARRDAATGESAPSAAPARDTGPTDDSGAAREPALADAPSAELAARPSERAPVSPDDAAERDDGDDEEPADPPTPATPGPGQALLRIEAVALESGAPLVGIDLDVLPTNDDDDDREWLFSTQSDPSRGVEGDFVVSDAAGRAELVLQADYAYTLRGMGENGRADEALLELAPLAAGETRSVRIALPTKWEREWHGRIVDGESERPLVGVDVVAYGSGAERVEQLVELTRARSGADGRVALRLPAWEGALVRCEFDGWFPGGAEIGAGGFTEEEPQQVVLRRPAKLVVRVREADGSDAAGVDVRVGVPPWFAIEGWSAVNLVWSGVTGADGRREFAGLPAEAEIFVTLSRVGGVLEWTKLGEAVELSPGESREVLWTLREGVALRGRVRDRVGRAVAGLELALYESSYDFGRWWPASALGRWVSVHSFGDSRSVASATTDANGHFAFDSVRPGSSFLLPGGEEDQVPDVAWPFVAPAGEAPSELDLRLDRGLWITGTVHGPDGEPVSAGSVSCRSVSEPSIGTDDWPGRAGEFSLGPLLDGRHVVRASPPDEEPYFAASEDVALDAGARDVALALRWGGRIVVVPADADGSVVDGSAAARLFLRGAHVSYDDELAFDGVVPGAYDVLVWAGDEQVGVVRNIAVVERATREIVVTVGHGARVATPEDVEAWVEWEGLDVGPRSPGIGSVAWPLLPPGTVTIRSFTYDANGTRRVVDERVRTLVAGEEWIYEGPL